MAVDSPFCNPKFFRQDGEVMGFYLMPRFIAAFTPLALFCFGTVIAGTADAPAHAAPAAALYCTSPGLPVGCVGQPAMRAITPGVGAPGVGVTPGLGMGAPGVGARPAAGPGVGPNMGGPANRGGLR